MSTNLNTHPENSEEDRDLAIALEWQRNMRKELEAENLAAERPPARNDNNYMAKRVVAQALGLPTKPNTTDNEQAEPSGDTQAVEAESEPSKSDVADETSNVVRLPEQAREFGLLTRADVQGEPSAIPLIHGLISKGQLTMIAGPSGCGKSVLQLHLGAALLNAPEVFGYAIPKRARFLYVNLEGDLKHRLEAIEQHHPGWSFPAPEAIFLTRPWRLNDWDSVEGLAHHVQQAGGVDVIFIDTLNRAIPGSDENLSTDMGVVIKHSNRLIELTGAAVVLTHHTGKAKERGPRGHSSLYVLAPIQN